LHRVLWNLYIVHSPTYALLLKLEKFKIYIKRHINIAPTSFVLRPSSGSLYRVWQNYISVKHSFKLRRYTSGGDVAACHAATSPPNV